MSKATITIFEVGDGSCNLDIDFDPPLSGGDRDEEPKTHKLVFDMLEAVYSEIDSVKEETGKELLYSFVFR